MKTPRGCPSPAHATCPMMTWRPSLVRLKKPTRGSSLRARRRPPPVMASFQKIRDGEDAAEDWKQQPKTVIGGGATASEDWKPKPKPGGSGGAAAAEDRRDKPKPGGAAGGGGATAAEDERNKPKSGAAAPAAGGESSEAKRPPPRRLPHLEVPQPGDFSTEALERL